MKVRTECVHGHYENHQIDRQVGEGIVMEILCDGGTELDLQAEQIGERWVWVESEDS